ncbi:hypothetical protein ACS0TY_024978 [Phlomoides rotata]
MNQWINPYKEKFVCFFTNQVMHYENMTTNMVESHHAALKMMLGNSLGSFEHNWTKTHTLYGANHNVIKHSFEKSVNVAQHKFKPIIYKEIRGIVSVVALEILFDDVKRIESGESDPLNCKHYLRQVCGLPCTHELTEFLSLGSPYL